MRCPFCHDNDDKVIDSRSIDAGKSIRRRRSCNTCGKRFTTYEHIEESIRVTVVKKDGSRVPYDRTKVLKGLQLACYKRPVPMERLTAIVDEIEEELFHRNEREVEAVEIGRLVMERLRRLDHVAYLRFASVYLKIDKLDDLLAEMTEVRDETPPPVEGQEGLF